MWRKRVFMMMTGLWADLDSQRPSSWNCVLNFGQYWRDPHGEITLYLFHCKYCDYIRPLGHWHFSAGVGRPIGDVTGIPEPHHATCMGCHSRSGTPIQLFSLSTSWKGQNQNEICSGRRFSQCNRCYWLHSCCNKGTIWELIYFPLPKTFPLSECANHTWCTLVSDKCSCEMAWVNPWFLHFIQQ